MKLSTDVNGELVEVFEATKHFATDGNGTYSSEIERQEKINQ